MSTEKEWISGCYGMQHPAVLVAANGLVYRRDRGPLEILTGIRGPGRWEAGTLTLAPGGFVSPKDDSPLFCALREVGEETNALTVPDGYASFYEGGPTQYRWVWSNSQQKAFKTNEIVQEIPVVTLNYLLRFHAGAQEPRETKEITDIAWVRVQDFRGQDHERCSFDQALVFEEALKIFEAREWV